MIDYRFFAWTASVWLSSLFFLFGAALAVAQSGSVPDNYVINVGDEIEVDILDDREPPQRFTVGRDGAVQLPFIGGLEIASVSVSAARERVRSAYIEREIFLNPTVEISIAGFRPISVLGDVREPGNFEYQPFMTAEQAVGLAGGPAISANNEEARVLEKRGLEGALTNFEYDLAASAARYARVRAQLAGADSLQWTDLPLELRAAVNRELFDEHKIQEDQIIILEKQDAETRYSLLADAVEEAESRVSLLDQRALVQAGIQEAVKSEFERIQDLADRSLVPRARVPDAERAMAVAEDNLLNLQEQRSGVLVQAANLKSQLIQFRAEREQRLLTESQQHLNEVKKQITSRDSIADRILLLQQWINAASGMDTELLVKYQVRRREETGIATVALKPFDELLPGDLLIVSVISPDPSEELQ